MNFYVYVYLDPRRPGTYVYGLYKFDYEPFYVGKGKNNRYYDHIKRRASYKTPVAKKVRSLMENGTKPEILIYQDKLNSINAYELETKMINMIGRRDLGTGPLLNLTDGGDGVSNVSQLTREKLRNKIVSEATKQKIRAKRAKQIFSEESIKKRNKTMETSMIGNSNGAKQFVIFSIKTGNYEIVKNLKKYSVDNKLNYSHMLDVSKERRKHHKGLVVQIYDDDLQKIIGKMKNVTIVRNFPVREKLIL